MQFSDSYVENMHSFVNNVRTKDGGTHEARARSAITRTFNDHARRTDILQEKDKNLDGNDVRAGLLLVISVRVAEEYLALQAAAKGRIGTPEVRSVVDSVVSEKLTYFLEENREIAKSLLTKAIKAKEAREAAQKAREDARNGKKRKRN